MLLGCNVGVGESSSNTSTAVSKAMIHDGNNAQQLLHHTSVRRRRVLKAVSTMIFG